MNENEENNLEEEKQEEQFVSKKAYQEVSGDMHKYKSELQETKARLAEIEAIQETKEQEALQEQGRWEELYNTSKEQLTTLQSERNQERDKFIGYHKKNSVLQHIGGFKRDEYNSFINVENIKLNDDGSINNESLTSEVDRIKQEYPELIKTNSSTKLPKEAPSQNEIGNKGYDKMTEAEKVLVKRQLLTKPEGY